MNKFKDDCKNKSSKSIRNVNCSVYLKAAIKQK